MRKNIAFIVALVIVLTLGLIWLKASRAGGITINNNITEVVEVRTEINTITSGLSYNDLAKGLSMAAASGGHQLDWSSYRWQGSITGAWYDETDAVSFAVGKRWDRLGDALIHFNYTQNGSENLYVIGSTFRF